MEKKWKNLIIVIIFFLILFLAGFFFLQTPKTTEKNTVNLDEGFQEINSILSSNNLAFSKLQKADIILIQDGELVNDFSESSFSKLEADFKTLKAKYQTKQDSSEKEALIRSIDLYLELIGTEKKEKELYNLAVYLENNVTDFQSGCKNKDKFLLLANGELELINNLSELNEKTNQFLLEFADLEKVDQLLLDIDTVTGFDDTYDFVSDVEDLDYACSILLENEGNQ